MTGAALLAAVSIALDLWQQDGGKSDLLALLDRTTDTLAVSMRDLERQQSSTT